MAGQGTTTKLYANELKHSGWSVLYMCIPNTAHIGVVPIMTSHGVSKQRYPDIAALKADKLLLVEVEMSLTEAVTADIILRFEEMREALGNQIVYSKWANKVSDITQVSFPTAPIIETRLIIVKPIRAKESAFVNQLRSNGIEIVCPTKMPSYNSVIV